jgi:hypothetical protein
MTGPAKSLRVLRIAMLLAVLAALIPVAVQVGLLYQEGADYEQPPAESLLITRRLILALYALPALLAAASFLALPRLTCCNAVRCLRVLATLSLLTGMQGCVIVLSLPYGFGSGYEHASAEQWRHLRMTGYTGEGGVLLAVGLLFLSFIVKDSQEWSRRQRTSPDHAGAPSTGPSPTSKP